MTGFHNPAPEQIRALLDRAHVIAVVGLSDDPSRPSYGVTDSMRKMNYRILPINPTLSQWQGLPVFASLEAAARSLEAHEHIDIVNVFRRPAQVDAVVDDCIRLGVGNLWLQQGVINEPAALRATCAGITVVMDRCIYVDRMSMRG